MQESVIKVENLVKTYRLYNRNSDRIKEAINPFGKRYSKDFYALDDISFEIHKGDTVGIIGKNGAGKSTLLKILTGVLTPTSGKVEISGKIAALLELGAGFNPELTGRENIFFNGTIMGFTEKEMVDKVDDIINFADIGEFIDQPVRMYSSGMFARLAFAVNVEVHPNILIVDEALSVGDSFFQQKCIAKMKQMQQQGVTILFVSHAISSVKALCKKCIYLKKGKIVAYDLAEKVCSMYQNETTDINKNILNLENNKGSIKINPTMIDKKLFRIDKKLNSRITQRSGDGKCILTAVDFLDDKNKRIVSQEMFKPIIMNLSFKTNENIDEGCALGVLCRNDLGIDVFVGNLNYYSIFLPHINKNINFTVRLTYKINLAPGRYFWGFGLKPEVSGNHFYDRCFNAAKIEITQPKSIKDPIGGVVYAELQDAEVNS